MSDVTQRHAALHLGVAEQGKLYALDGAHDEALRHYQQALRMAVDSGAPEVFFRHYTQCVMESLEATGSYDGVQRYCEDADRHYQALDRQGALFALDHGSILERLGVVQLKAGEVDAARASLRRALALAGPRGLPLAAQVLGWLDRGMTVSDRHLTDAQRRHGYFVVTRERVDPDRAIPLPGGGETAAAGLV
ncbi:peptidylprolyl isomerase [Methylonatrum kenyense]|uniref:peptidylprolyl isomerase n=1 Tax=Methylonatrum kenyense TaxID=455253 RepID=UPI0020BF7D94|nr:peptidylprolyl isomerase [Methylonatrum kenyense]MCK8515363.1 peptidylprolyl isomerase [Methylonatrum kenyense]